jgi:predicted amidophosphoribosyltransferase
VYSSLRDPDCVQVFMHGQVKVLVVYWRSRILPTCLKPNDHHVFLCLAQMYDKLLFTVVIFIIGMYLGTASQNVSALYFRAVYNILQCYSDI